MIGKWLKQCKCGGRYYGNKLDISCGKCVDKTVMEKCECGCGKEFEWSGKGKKRKYYDRACQMRARRKTEAGKKYVEEYNKRYKRAEKEIKCKFPLCGVVFRSSYSTRVYCDEHSNSTSASKVWRKNNPLKAKAHERVNSLYRDRRSYRDDVVRKRDACIVCGDEKTQAHHHNYEKPLDVVFLCNEHHREMHRWDALAV